MNVHDFQDDGIPIRRKRPARSVLSSTILLPLGLVAVGLVALAVLLLFATRKQQQDVVAQSSAPPVSAIPREGGGIVPEATIPPPAVARRPLAELPKVPLLGPTAEREGCDWTMKELVNYLNSKGLQVEMEEMGRLVGPIVHLSSRRHAVLKKAGTGFEVFRDDAVTAGTEPTAQRAKDYSGTMKDGFCWGRFVFFGGPEKLRNEIWAVLPGSR